MSTGQIKILVLICKLGPTKFWWSATELVQRGVYGTPGTVGASLKFLAKSGHLEIEKTQVRHSPYKYRITPKGIKLAKEHTEQAK
jgi:hypothetical protein